MSFLTDQDLTQSVSGIDFSPMNGSRVVILGASGCIGGAIAEALLWKKRNGLNIDLLLVGRSKENLYKRFPDYNNFLIWDTSENIPNEFPPWDYLVHAASDASPKKYLRTPFDTSLSNTHGIISLIQTNYHVKKNNFKVLFISSGEVYGSPAIENVPTPEEYIALSDHLDERACYREAKKYSESILWSARKQLGIKGSVSRPIHVYGPGLFPDDGRVICDFLRNAIQKKPIIMFSDGSAQRSFCYISDATRLHLSILLSENDGLICNVGRDDTQISIYNLALLISEQFNGQGIEQRNIGHTKGSPQISVPDMQKAKKLFNYEPEVSLEEGLLRLSQWWKKEKLV